MTTMKFWRNGFGQTPPQLEIGAGRGLDDRIRMLFGAVTISILESPLSIQTGFDLVRGCGGGDDLCEVEKIFWGLRRKFEYRGDPRSFNAFHTLKRTVEYGAANCASATVALCAVLSGQEFHVGARCFEQWVPELGRPDFDHVCALVALPKYQRSGDTLRSMPLDLGMPSFRQTFPGWQLPPEAVTSTRDYWYNPVVWQRWYARQDWSDNPSSRGNILRGMPIVKSSRL